MTAKPFKDLVGGLLDVAIPTFGEKVKYCPLSGGQFHFTAVFDIEFFQINPQTQVVTSVNRPRIGIRLKDIPKEPMQDDKVIIYPDTYFVTEISEDGQGGAVLFLKKQIDDEQTT